MDSGLIMLVAGVVLLAIAYVTMTHSLSSREIAAVASLGALSAAGRIAFAAVPSVQPSTVLVIVSGWVLGPSAGFTVGATTALVSNVFLGQGPWTIWQMLSWGGIGMVAGFLGKLDLSHPDAVDHRVLGGRRIRLRPRDGPVVLGVVHLPAHAGLAAADRGDEPAVRRDARGRKRRLRRSLRRTCGRPAPAVPRADARHLCRGGLACVARGAGHARAGPPPRSSACSRSHLAAALVRPLVPPRSTPSVPRALDYLHACQRGDGGFAEKTGSASSEALTAWAIVAIASAGEDPNQWKVGSASPTDFLAKKSSSWRTTTDYARTTLAVVAAEKNPRSFGGVDLIGKMRADEQDRGADGDQIGPYVNSHIWALIALESAGQTITPREIQWLVGQQNADGGWGWAPGLASDTNDTAAALQALIGAGQSPTSAPVTQALAYLRARQLADGGFTYSGTKSDADSTAWVIQALRAAGQPPEQQRKSGKDPLTFLRSLQAADGSLRYSASSTANPLLVTVQSISALSGRTLPLKLTRPASAVLPWKPAIAVQSPAVGAVVAWPAGSAIRVSVTDGQGTGIAAGGVTIKVDGKALKTTTSGQMAEAKPAALANGKHTVVVSAKDRAGNSATVATWQFTVSPTAVAAPVSTAATTTPLVFGTTAVDAAGAVSTASPTAGETTAAAAAATVLNSEKPQPTRSRSRQILLGILAALTVSALGVAVALAVLHWRGAQAARS